MSDYQNPQSMGHLGGSPKSLAQTMSEKALAGAQEVLQMKQVFMGFVHESEFTVQRSRGYVATLLVKMPQEYIDEHQANLVEEINIEYAHLQDNPHIAIDPFAEQKRELGPAIVDGICGKWSSQFREDPTLQGEAIVMDYGKESKVATIRIFSAPEGLLSPLHCLKIRYEAVPM
jgi:uncharacterized protein YuzE